MTRRIVLGLAFLTLAVAFLSGFWLTGWLYMIVLSAQIPMWLLLEHLNRAWAQREREEDRMIRRIERRLAEMQNQRLPYSRRSEIPPVNSQKSRP